MLEFVRAWGKDGIVLAMIYGRRPHTRSLAALAIFGARRMNAFENGTR